MDFLGKIEQGVKDRFGQKDGDQVGQFEEGFGGGQDGGQYGQQSGGLSQWGSSKFYGVKSVATGMYLAAHPDGQLVAEDDTTGHHDVPWTIYTTQDGQCSARPSCPSQASCRCS